jgi:hypothetical protein
MWLASGQCWREKQTQGQAGQQPAAPDWLQSGPCHVYSFGCLCSFRLLWCLNSPAGEPGTLAG